MKDGHWWDGWEAADEERRREMVLRWYGVLSVHEDPGRASACQANVPLEVLSIADAEGLSIGLIVRSCKRLPDSLLTIAAARAEDVVREAVAGKSAVRRMKALVAKLAQDPSVAVRLALCRNRNVPIETILALMQDSDEDVRWAASNQFMWRTGGASPDGADGAR